VGSQTYGQVEPPIRVDESDDPVRYGSVRFTTLATVTTVLTRVVVVHFILM